MIRHFLLIALSLPLVGCASKNAANKMSADAPGPKKITATVQPEAPPQARVLPVNGRIARVNDDLRFVIIDFMNSRQPRLEQKLSVYRVGQKVGEIKVSGPYRNTTVAADIVAGEAKYGDEVRTD